MSKVMVTGVAGFMGSNLVEAMLLRGYHVVGVDNLSQGDELNMTSFRNRPQFEFHAIDIRDRAAMSTAARGCSAIVHLAAYKIPRYADALDTLHINTVGSENVVLAAIENGAKVVAASTSDVYGKNPAVPFHEESNMVIGPPTVRRWAYAVSKMFEEQLLFAYRERHGVRVTLMRFFGGYGPGQSLTWWGGPQSVFINAALEGKPLEVHGDGLQTRSFTYVSDHVAGILLCLEKSEADNQVMNLGATREITIIDLARLVWRLIRGPQCEPQINMIPYSTFGKYEDVMRRIPDISKARTTLGFEPQVELEDGLRRTIRWQIDRRTALGMESPFAPETLQRVA